MGKIGGLEKIKYEFHKENALRISGATMIGVDRTTGCGHIRKNHNYRCFCENRNNMATDHRRRRRCRAAAHWRPPSTRVRPVAPSPDP